MSSIFNSESWKKAVGTYKNNQSAQKPMMPAGAIGALSGVTTTPKPPQAAGLPPVAIKAANNVRSGITSVPSVPAAAKTAAQTMVATTSQPRTEQALSAQANLVNTPFSYNADSDPAYQAALRAAQQNLSVNQKNTNAQLRATGQGKSSYSETVANQLANQSAENVANNILPIYAQQAYQQYQDNIGNQRNLYQDYNQQDFQNPITEAQVTGNYLPAEAKQAIQNLIGLKSQAETKGITKDARTQLSTEADAIRAQLKALGIDPSFYGADKTAAQASANNPGIRTLQGQQLDLQGKQANLDAATAVSNMTGKVITPQTDWQGLVRQAANPNTPLSLDGQNQAYNQGITTAQLTGYLNGKQTTAEQQRQLTNLWTVAEQTGTIPNELADLYGISRGTQTQAAKQFAAQMANESRGLDISQQNANTSQDSQAFNQAQAIADAQAAAAQTMTPQDYAKTYVNPIAQYKKGVVTNKNDVISSIVASGYDDDKVDSLFRQYGITESDIKSYRSTYGLGG